MKFLKQSFPSLNFFFFPSRLRLGNQLSADRLSFSSSFLRSFFPLLIFTIPISCKDTGTNPNKTIKTPSEMTWTSTTITSPDTTSIQVLPENLVVFSENDMWLVAWSDVARGLLWRYDGKTWTESNIVADVGGMRVNDVAGYSSNDLWTAGYSGDKIFLAHYDGYRWTRQNNMNIKGEILDMTKDADGNIWACGRNGVILKYDKTKWIADTIKINKYQDVSYALRSVEYGNNKILVLATTNDSKRQRTVYYYIYGDINNWTVADSMVVDNPSSEIKWGNFGLFRLESNEIYSYGLSGIWKLKDNTWNKIFDLGSEVYGMYGIGANYMVAVSAFKRIYFYDGSNWESISDLFKVDDPYFVFKNVWTDGYETFITGHNFQGLTKTTVWHGK